MPAPMVQLDRVTRRFGRLTAVDNLSLLIPKGEIFGLLGPDGAGKTTTLRMICGLIDPTEGQVRVSGLEVGANIDTVKDQLGYMAQRFGLYADLTVDENLAFYGDLFGVTGTERETLTIRLLEMTRMAPFRSRPAGKLSGGMKQKLALMCTLLHHPQLLILDEPTNGVDPLSRRDFWVILNELVKNGLTIFVSTSYLDEAERCHRVGLMHNGRLIRCDTPSALKTAMAPRTFSVEAADRRAARELLLTVPGVIGAEPAGAELHVYLDQNVSPESVTARAPGLTLHPLLPSLEDVFIALIRAEQRATAEAPHA